MAFAWNFDADPLEILSDPLEFRPGRRLYTEESSSVTTENRKIPKMSRCMKWVAVKDGEGLLYGFCTEFRCGSIGNTPGPIGISTWTAAIYRQTPDQPPQRPLC